MQQEEFDKWATNVKKVFNAQIRLDKMKKSKKFKRKNIKIAEGILKRLRHKNHIKMFEGNLEMQERVAVHCAKDWSNFIFLK